MQKYDIAAYVWPSYTGKEMRSRIFWPDGIGEWQTVLCQDKNSVGKKEGYVWDRKPLWGACDEADPNVMEKQIDEATKHGVNVFIYDWYWFDHRPFLEQCLDDGFLKAKNNEKMSFYLMWANHDANYVWDLRISDTTWKEDCTVWDGAVSREDFDRVVDRVIEKYFKKPNYYKINGKPVFMIYHAENLIRGLGGIKEAVDALDSFRKKTVEAGFLGLELQFAYRGERNSNLSGVDGEQKIVAKELLSMLRFDSLTNYQFAHFCDMNREYTEILKDVNKLWAQIDANYSVPYYPHVSIGWDNNPRFKSFVPVVCKGNTPEKFEEALRMAKHYVDTHALPVPLITINSWNEWTETSYLEPDTKYGYGYLDAVKNVFLGNK